MAKVRIALLDMNNNHINEGMRNIMEIAEQFREITDSGIQIKLHDVRFRNEIPKVEDFDVFISSGGPGNPHPEGYAWEKPYYQFLEEVWQHNLQHARKKYLFLICHSFQIASIHWKIGNICKRKSYSFGVMPIHKTEYGENEVLFNGLKNPFYAVDSRAYQFIEPEEQTMAALGMQIVALEKMRPHIRLDRAVMAVRFSPEIFGTQFHAEADPQGMLRNLEDDRNRAAMIESHGLEKYLETIDRLDDPDKIIQTQATILPTFLANAYRQLTTV